MGRKNAGLMDVTRDPPRDVTLDRVHELGVGIEHFHRRITDNGNGLPGEVGVLRLHHQKHLVLLILLDPTNHRTNGAPWQNHGQAEQARCVNP